MSDNGIESEIVSKLISQIKVIALKLKRYKKDENHNKGEVGGRVEGARPRSTRTLQVDLKVFKVRQY